MTPPKRKEQGKIYKTKVAEPCVRKKEKRFGCGDKLKRRFTIPRMERDEKKNRDVTVLSVELKRLTTIYLGLSSVSVCSGSV